MSGAQISGANNYCGYLQGAQVGVVNIAGEVEGAQVGVVNIAKRVRGGQVGLVNISRTIEGVPAGLVSLTRNGQWHVEAWGDGNRFFHLGFRLGSRYVYTLFTTGYRPDNPARWSYGIGMGGHIPLDPFFVNVDVTLHDHHRGFEYWYPEDEGPNLVPEVRVMGGYQLGRRIGIYGGGSFQVFFPQWYSYESMSLFIDEGRDPNKTFAKPTFFIGLQI